MKSVITRSKNYRHNRVMHALPGAATGAVLPGALMATTVNLDLPEAAMRGDIPGLVKASW